MLLVPPPMLRGHAVTAVDFDGTNDYMTRGANPTGLADGKDGIISVWFRVDGGAGTDRYICANNTANPYFTVGINNANTVEIYGDNAASAAILTLNTAATFAAGATWRHLLASWNLATSASHLYINDVADNVVGTLTNDTIDYAKSNFSVGAVVDGSAKFNGCLAEFFFNPTYLDLSVAANRRLFISATGKPVNLGPTGAIPLGVQPLLYFGIDSNTASAFATNKGSGGNFTITGALDMASTSPSS